MAEELSGSIFQSTSVDRVMVTDPTQIKDPTIINVPSDSMKGKLKSALGTLKPALKAAKDIANLVEDVKSGWLSKEALFSRALDVLGPSVSSILGGVSEAVKETIGETAFEVMGNVGDATRGILDVAGTITQITSGNSIYTSDVTRAIGDILGNDKLLSFTNLQAEAGVISGILDAVVTAGVPQLVDDVVQMTKYDDVRLESMAWLSTRAIDIGDRVLLDKTIDFVGPEGVLAKTPDFVKKTSENYRSILKTTSEMATEAVALRNTLGSVDELWDRVSGDKGGYYRLDNYSNASADFDRIMTSTTDSIDGLLTMTSKAYDQVFSTPAAVIKSQYPDVVIKDDSNDLDSPRRQAQYEAARQELINNPWTSVTEGRRLGEPTLEQLIFGF